MRTEAEVRDELENWKDMDKEESDREVQFVIKVLRWILGEIDELW